ncbi:5973_t:CDS:2, partial [Cetraspora pellucida]
IPVFSSDYICTEIYDDFDGHNRRYWIYDVCKKLLVLLSDNITTPVEVLCPSGLSPGNEAC